MRPSWDQYFLGIAGAVSLRGTCDRKKVGAVLVNPVTRAILSTGYNGSIPGEPHCDEIGHDMVDGHCERTVHGELNAVVHAALVGVSLAGATLYVNTFPCWGCFKALASAGVRRIVSADVYRRDERVDEAAKRIGVEIVVVS